MRLFHTLILSAGFVLTLSTGFSQSVPGAMGYHEQALMFSNYNYTGSARIQGLGNTQVSLGGDISSALSNPAGLGFYNRSEVSLTPSYNSYTANTNYWSNSTSTTTGKFNVDNFGAVFNKTKDDIVAGKWKGGSFAISYSKINEFNSDIIYSGMNENNDILDFYVQDANNQNVDFDQLAGVTYGAFDTYLMSEFVDVFLTNSDSSTALFYERTFFSEYPTDRYPTNQQEIISTTGGQNQWNFSYGGNYGDFIYFGATLGVQTIRYNILKQYTETYPGLESDNLSNSFLVENLNTEGIGVNGTFGLIVRPISQMTFGLSLITPSYLSMSERYYYSTEANYNNFNMNNYGNYFDANYSDIVNPEFIDEDSPYYPESYTTFYEDDAVLNSQTHNQDESFFDYTITTPLRLNVGTTFFINKNGFITADIEYVDYSTMKIKDLEGYLESENEVVGELYQSVLNFRAGAEWRIKNYRLRAGYNYRPNPYKDESINNVTQAFSAGAGVRSSKFFLDLAATYKMYTSTYAPYLLDNTESYLETSYVEIDNEDLNIVLSIGLFF